MRAAERGQDEHWHETSSSGRASDGTKMKVRDGLGKVDGSNDGKKYVMRPLNLTGI